MYRLALRRGMALVRSRGHQRQISTVLLRRPVSSLPSRLLDGGAQVVVYRPASIFSAVPRMAFRALRPLVLAGGAGAGAVAYVGSKVDGAFDLNAAMTHTGFSSAVNDRLNSAKEWGSTAFFKASETAGDAFDAAASTAAGARDNVARGIDGAASWTSSTLSGFGKWVSDKFSSEGNEADEGEAEFLSFDEAESAKSTGGRPSPGEYGAMAAAAALATNRDESDVTESSSELMNLTRKLIEIRSILLSIDHAEALQLPSIVVIGSQSSGKSSVLEAVVGRDFLPKGNNMVTRRPIELTLIHTPPTAADPRPLDYAEFPALGANRITDFDMVRQTLTELNLAVPDTEAVSDTPIELRIYSPRVPDLSLVDLPGYVQLSSMDQPDALKKKIADLCEKYIRAPNLILAVCAADVDLANSPALRASRRVDPLGLRTIGVVTKMDLIDPKHGAQVLSNDRYPLALGYIGVVCKAPATTSAGRVAKSIGWKSDEPAPLQEPIARQEANFFGSHAEDFNKPGLLVGTGTLKRRLVEVLEESMSNSLVSVANGVQMELEEASYKFKVEYNDRAISAESYVAETMDALKGRVAAFSKALGKPEARRRLKEHLDNRVMEILAQHYWGDSRLADLTAHVNAKGKTPPADGLYWDHKLEATTSALTKSGIGRLSTQMIVDLVRSQVAHIASEEPFSHHLQTTERINALSDAILNQRYAITAEQVENCVKPFKYEVEVDDREWSAGRDRAIQAMQHESKMCQDGLEGIQSAVGKRRLASAVSYVRDVEERERKRAQRRLSKMHEDSDELTSGEVPEDENDPTRPMYNPALLAKARDAKFLEQRSGILKDRTNALKSRRCKSGPDAKSDCPEIFLDIVADKLAYTAVMFINIELLAEFFYQFPREIDSRLIYDADRSEMAQFARENPVIRKHLDLQERKEKLELVSGKLDSLLTLQAERNGGKNAGPQSRRGLFGRLF